MDILELIKLADGSIPEGKTSEFNEKFRKNYKHVNEVEKIRSDAEKYKKEVETLTTSVKELEGYKTKYTEAESLLTKTKEEYDTKIKTIEMDSILDSEFSGLQFVNDRTKQSILTEVKGKGFELKDGKLEGLTEYINELKKEEGILVKPNMFSGGTGGKQDFVKDVSKVDEIRLSMGLEPLGGNKE